ncbi:hypothetical protein D4Z77_08815 [Campylobacter coli]|nr:hypothetical protein D4Z77_08815 [Campylobacter coli]
MFSHMYFPPVDHCWRSAFQRQVKDIGNEIGDGIPDQDLMETPPGHPVFGTCYLQGPWTPSEVYYSETNPTSCMWCPQ